MGLLRGVVNGTQRLGLAKSVTSITPTANSDAGFRSRIMLLNTQYNNEPPVAVFAGKAEGLWYDPSDLSTMWQDSAQTIPVTGLGQPVGFILDKSGNSCHGIQTTDTKRPTLEARSNFLIDTDVLPTQTVATRGQNLTTAQSYTLSFYGTGTITLSGTSTAGPLVGTGINDRVVLTFTALTGALTLTVSGSVLKAQLEFGTVATAYQRVTADNDYEDIGLPRYLQFDGVDDFLSTTVRFANYNVIHLWIGLMKLFNNRIQVHVELGSVNSSNGFFLGGPAANSQQFEYYFANPNNNPIARTYPNAKADVLTVRYYGVVDAANNPQQSILLRINGATLLPSVAEGGGGVTNKKYMTGILYVGGRSSLTTQQSNGRIYQLIIAGDTAMDANRIGVQFTRLSNVVERYVAKKTGVAL